MICLIIQIGFDFFLKHHLLTFQFQAEYTDCILLVCPNVLFKLLLEPVHGTIPHAFRNADQDWNGFRKCRRLPIGYIKICNILVSILIIDLRFVVWRNCKIIYCNAAVILRNVLTATMKTRLTHFSVLWPCEWLRS